MPARIPLDPNRLLIVQPYIPAYRVPLFAAMKAGLARYGIEMAVAAAHAGGADHSRGDDVTASSADFVLDERRMSVGPKSLLVRQVGPVIESFRPGFVIVEQAIKNAESWPLLLASGRRRDRPAVAMWGQGRSYSTSQSAVAARAKQWLTRRADWFFAYTQAGADYIVANGFTPSRTTVLWNSTDTAALRSDVESLSASDVEAYRAFHGLAAGRTALFLGGIDARKGIPFLLAAAREVAGRLQGFTLLIGGSGEMADDVVREQAAGGPVRYLGRVDGRDRALALAAADVLMLPEWVGLVAVDALATGMPIVTTRHPSHSPEVEYLADGQTAVFSDHEVGSYAFAVAGLLDDRERREQMSHRCQRASEQLSIEHMADNFVGGICRWRLGSFRN